MDDSIWDAPLAQETPKRSAGDFSRAGDDGTPSRPTKRARQTLFLVNSDDDDSFDPSQAGPSSKSKSNRNSRAEPVDKPPPAQDLNIEELFADFDDDDMEISKPLPALVDEEELTRRAEAKYKRINKEKEASLHQIMPSSSPGRESDAGIGSKKGKRKEKGGEEKKARKRQAKLDENLLLGPSGFPQLVKMTKDFRIKGKGYEAADLDRLLKVYQYWTHQLYPKTTFSDTVERVEKLCHTRRMNVSLSVWRDQAHGKPIQLPEDDEEDGEEVDVIVDDGELRTSKTHDLPPSSPHRPSSRGSSPPTDAPDADEDDEEFWKSLDMGLPGGGAPMEEPLSDVPPAPPTSSGAPSDMDEDEDMWDIVNQIEQEASGPTGTGDVENSARASGFAAGALLNKPHPKDDWDDMYL
ncbi:replication fork protection component Swi3-domain-containing protein [Crepidotus variabilis]|uniref:Chromosome segregation in meiosis protein n=1 Tax=Crepidotus variabilis TaxID=179855 RepID=A0A9P6EUP9_9AGAR|nr:replication fork protection component Swi3-domain-containing protein [Crepidotus variabilis]